MSERLWKVSAVTLWVLCMTAALVLAVRFTPAAQMALCFVGIGLARTIWKRAERKAP
jgi:hypothetical protein